MHCSTFDTWADRWMDLAKFAGSHLPDPDDRISGLLKAWDRPIPGDWERGKDPQLHASRYRRGDKGRPHPGEHTIEHEILTGLEQVRCLGGRLVDGINAMPLSKDPSGGRRGNVEADLFLLLERQGCYYLAICEVKATSDTPWYAAIEGLRQLKLLQCSQAAQQLFRERGSQPTLPDQLPILNLVIAPGQYYQQPGRKTNALGPTNRLLAEFTRKTGIEAHLTAWDADARVIDRI